MSPFKFMMRTFAYGALISIAVTAWLFVEANDWAHYVAAVIICVLMLLVSLLVGFYRACNYQLLRERGSGAIHYPMHNQFRIQMAQVDVQVRRAQRWSV
jgi:apolipoprotein N-acyltransferase